MLPLTMSSLKEALGKIIDVLETEEIDYMIVGGFATSYHNGILGENGKRNGGSSGGPSENLLFFPR
jgi:hypothetical protein